MDTEQFCAPPMTTGALKAYFRARGRTAPDTDVELVHFLQTEDCERWLLEVWPAVVEPRIRRALDAGARPVLGFSCYTWNVAELLVLTKRIKSAHPDVLIVAGGPHVQRAEDFLYGDGIDVIVLGEGEETFTELLDCTSPAEWREVAGLAFVDEGGLVRSTPSRPRAVDLDRFPTALDVVALRDEAGRPLYRQVAYETSRGCPYRCAFCEWGTGAIGTKMYQYSLPRVRSDLERLIEGGIRDIWLTDSNFGALREDLEKAEIIVDLRRRTGLPSTFATSWSKNHNRRVQEIVRLMHRNGLLSHYHLALQTLTPRALELSHRTNMRANDYEPVVKSLAAEGVPVTAELIWGLPGDTLGEFEANLDHLLAVFPNVNIFGYTLLPGTEFFDRRDEYRLETLPVAGYGKAKGEYVVGCHTFTRSEGEEGYFLITSYIVLARGHIMPLTVRYLSLLGVMPVAVMLRGVMRALLATFSAEFPDLDRTDRMQVYERRSRLYVHFLSDLEGTFETIRAAVCGWLSEVGRPELRPQVERVLELDRALCPRTGRARTTLEEFDFDAERVETFLAAMQLPDEDLLVNTEPAVLEIRHPGHVGEVLHDPDGGSWMRGRVVPATANPEPPVTTTDAAPSV